jgi:hypothetical protein
VVSNQILYKARFKSNILNVSLHIQGGSDNSGTLSKPQRRIKKSYILIIISHKSSQLFVEAERKTNRHIPAKVNQ